MNEIKLRRIHLRGKLITLCGGNKVVELAASDMAMVVSGLTSMFGQQVKDYIRNGAFRVYHGKPSKKTIKDQHKVHELEDTVDIYMIPAVAGAGRVGQIIYGVVLIVVGIFMIWNGSGYLAIAKGVMVLAGGAMTVYTALNTPKAAQSRAAPEERASFLFNGAVNVVEQGGAVPLVFGRFKTGSTVVSAGVDTEQLAYYNSPVGTNVAPNSAFGIVEV